MRVLIVCCLLLLASSVSAKELAGTHVEESVTTESGAVLKLNGAGIRSKFFFDIYIAALYLTEQAGSTEAVLADTGPKRMLMHFLYKEVEKEKLIEAWNEGFKGNTAAAELTGLQERIDTFNSCFVTAKAGDQVILNYEPDSGTAVTVGGEVKATIAGKDFNDALLRIWLGEKPVTSDLKAALLGKD